VCNFVDEHPEVKKWEKGKQFKAWILLKSNWKSFI
jgi:hypothetical protein